MNRSQIAWHDHNSNQQAALVPKSNWKYPGPLPPVLPSKKKPEAFASGF